MKNFIQKFKENAESTTATVEIVGSNIKEISNAINEQIKSEKNLLVSLKNESLLSLLPKTINLIDKPNNDEIKNTPVSLTDSVLGISETGSIVIDNDDGFASYLTMLTAKHIVILNSNNIFDKPRDIFNRKDLLLKSKRSFSIITGPSATADMGSLVRGVHGPELLHIILIVENEK